VVLVHGLIKTIVCDNGAVFQSATFVNSMKSLGIKISSTCPYNPQANGRVERWNGTLKGIIKKYSDKEQFERDMHLKKAVYLYNTAKHRSTKYSPYELLHGRANRSPLNIQGEEPYDFEDLDPYRILARHNAELNMANASLVSKYYYDKKHTVSEYKVCQDIMIRLVSLPPRISSKLAHKWIGPFKLAKLVGPSDYPKSVIYADNNGRLHRASFGNVKPYYQRDDEESKRLEEIVKTYEQEGFPALVRGISADNGADSALLARDNEQPSEPEGGGRLSDEGELNWGDPSRTTLIDRLYEQRPLPTQQTLGQRPEVRPVVRSIVRPPCRPTILRRQSQPRWISVPLLPRGNPTVPASYDPSDLLKDLEEVNEQEVTQTTGNNEAEQVSSQREARQIDPGGVEAVPEGTLDRAEGGRQGPASIESSQ